MDKCVLLKHTRTYVFDYNTHEQLYKDLKAMFEPGNVITPADVANYDMAPAVAPVAETPPDLAKAAPTEVKATVIGSSARSKKAAATA